MSAKRRLVPPSEVEQHIQLLRRLGVPIGAIDIRADGVTVSPPQQSVGNAFDQWQATDQGGDRIARR